MRLSVENFSVTLLEAGGFASALRALRLPFGKDHRSAMRKELVNKVRDYISYGSEVLVSDEDVRLLSTLVKRGDEHAKVLRGVVVWCEIKAPRYFWQEMDTYRVGCERLSSESTMHIQGKGLSEDELVELKENMPEGTMQKRIWMFSYQTLRRIYFQRRDHRLPQWRKFCKWIETLPYAKEFILYGDSNNTDKQIPDSDN